MRFSRGLKESDQHDSYRYSDGPGLPILWNWDWLPAWPDRVETSTGVNRHFFRGLERKAAGAAKGNCPQSVTGRPYFGTPFQATQDEDEVKETQVIATVCLESRFRLCPGRKVPNEFDREPSLR